MLFGEYIPFYDAIPWFTKLFPEASNFNRGNEPGHRSRCRSAAASYRLGPLICYEDILPGFARRVAKLGPNAFINITNDAWFGRTAEPYQHLALAVFRSVEHRLEMVRAVNTGVSAHIDAAGPGPRSDRIGRSGRAADADAQDVADRSGDAARRGALPLHRRPVRIRMPGRAGRHPRPIAPAYTAGPDPGRKQRRGQFDEARMYPPPIWWVCVGARAMEQKRTADTQVASKWVVIVTLAVVVASFLGGSGYAEYRARRTHA